MKVISAESASQWPLYKKVMRLLDTEDALRAQAEEMGIHLTPYWPSVREGRVAMLALDVDGQRSTVELESFGSKAHRPFVFQHYGRYNQPPPAVCVKLLNEWLDRVFTEERTERGDMSRRNW